MPWTFRRPRRAACLLLACGLAAWQLGCGDDDTSFIDGVRVDEIELRDIAVTVTDTSAQITWLTREPTVSEVEFGLDELDEVATGPGSVTSHSVELTGLRPNTLYRYRVRGLGTRYRLRTLGGERQRIAFVSDRADSRRDVYLCLEWGENVTRVTDSGGHSPAISPDGTRLAWVAAGPGGLDDLFACALDAAGVVPGSTVNLTGTADRGEAHPAWLPDASAIVFVASPASQRSQIIRRQIADGAETVLIDNGAVCDEPAVSPEGDRLAFVSSTRTAVVQLRRRPVAPGSLTVVRDNAARTVVPAEEYTLLSEADGLVDFSRGNLADEDVLISYTGAGGAVVDEGHGVPRPRLEVFSADIDGGNLRRLTDDDDARSGPTFAPGGLVLHGREGSDSIVLVTVPAAGGNERTLIRDSDRNRDPSVAPDGSAFVFSSNRNDDGLVNLYRADFQGNVTELMNFSSGDTQPSWGPVPTEAE